jgi:hypothetical protein
MRLNLSAEELVESMSAEECRDIAEQIKLRQAKMMGLWFRAVRYNNEQVGGELYLKIRHTGTVDGVKLLRWLLPEEINLRDAKFIVEEIKRTDPTKDPEENP